MYAKNATNASLLALSTFKKKQPRKRQKKEVYTGGEFLLEHKGHSHKHNGEEKEEQDASLIEERDGEIFFTPPIRRNKETKVNITTLLERKENNEELNFEEAAMLGLYFSYLHFGKGGLV